MLRCQKNCSRADVAAARDTLHAPGRYTPSPGGMDTGLRRYDVMGVIAGVWLTARAVAVVMPAEGASPRAGTQGHSYP